MMPHMSDETVTRQLRIHGRVQGVYYRASMVAELSQALPPGQPLTLGGANNSWPMASRGLISICPTTVGSSSLVFAC